MPMLNPNPEERPNHNDVANAIIHFPGRRIITFEDTDEIFQFHKDEGITVYEPAENHLEYEVQEYVGEKTTTHYVSEVLATIRRLTREPRDIINQNQNLIPLANGILDTNTMLMKDYEKEFVFLRKHPINYNPAATCPKINQFLEEVSPDKQAMQTLKELVGYCYFRHYKFQTVFLLVGEGANGKSTFLNLLNAMLGSENVCNKPLQALTNYMFSQGSLFGKNANIFADLPQKNFNDTGILKALSGGDYIEAEIKHKGSIKFKNYAKLIASCNEIPQSPDDSEAFYRRWIIIPFPNKFEGSGAKKSLIDELTTPEELSGFFAEAIVSYLEAEKRGAFSYAPTTLEKKKAYLTHSNNVRLFCDERLEPDVSNEITKQEIYSTYCDWCKVLRLQPKNSVWFYREIRKLFGESVYQTRRDGVLRMAGIGWKKEDDPEGLAAFG
jgi:putative DNA primase/helicase